MQVLIKGKVCFGDPLWLLLSKPVSTGGLTWNPAWRWAYARWLLSMLSSAGKHSENAVFGIEG